jgi:hypothetical protein
MLQDKRRKLKGKPEISAWCSISSGSKKKIKLLKREVESKNSVAKI